MDPHADYLLAPPPGWRPDAFLTNLSAELHTHSLAVGTAGTLLILLGLCRALLAADERPRLRAALALLGVYAASLLARGELLSLGEDGAGYTWLALLGLMALCLAVISVVALLVFDLAARRFGVPRIMRDVTTAIAAAVSFVALLSRSGINVLQLVTTSAVITAVIGLALQDTLGNIIAGVALQIDSAVAIGDWIKVDERTTGCVVEVRWRSTVIETRNGDLLTFPNALLNRAIITRYAHAGLEHRQWVPFNVHLRHAPNRVIQVVQAALKDTANVSSRTPPECLLSGFDESSNKYVVRYRLIDFRHDEVTDSEVRKRIWYALHREELEMPYPARNVYVTQVGPERDREQTGRDLKRRLRALGRIAFFTPLSDEERQTLAEGLRFLPFAAGEIILHQGEAGDSLYVLRDGQVSVRLALEGSAKEIARLSAGDFFGEMSLLTGAPRSATVVALEDVECYVIDRALFEGIIAKNPSLTDAIGLLLGERERGLAEERRALEHGPTGAGHADLLGRIRRFFGLS